MEVTADEKIRQVVFFGSTTVLEGVHLINNPKYPGIAEDYSATFKKLKALLCDVFLTPHAGFFGLWNKIERMERGEKQNPFIDPTSYRDFIA